MSTASRSLGPVNHEGMHALANIAGLRMLTQARITVTAGANVAYTVTEPGTRRVACVHLGTGAGDIRFEHNAAAVATDFPIIPQRYVVIDCKKADTLNFYNTTGASIVVYFIETD